MQKIQTIEALKQIALLDLPGLTGVTDFPLNMHDIVRQLPVTFKQDTRDIHCVRELSGKLYLNSDKVPVIWVNPFDSQNYQRHTLAHLVSHLMLHLLPTLDDPDAEKEFHETKYTLRMDARQKPQEYQANYQARLLLVTNEALLEAVRARIEDYRSAKGSDDKLPVVILVDELRDYFGVSQEIIESRLVTSGLIPDLHDKTRQK